MALDFWGKQVEIDLTALTPVIITTLLSLILYLATIANVGRARGKYKIDVPAMTGHPDFDRIFRVQQNTLESIVIFLPSLWVFALVVSQEWAAILGAVWIIARVLYALGYAESAAKRILGFVMSMIVNITLVISSLVGLAIEMVK